MAAAGPVPSAISSNMSGFSASGSGKFPMAMAVGSEALASPSSMPVPNLMKWPTAQPGQLLQPGQAPLRSPPSAFRSLPSNYPVQSPRSPPSQWRAPGSMPPSASAGNIAQGPGRAAQSPPSTSRSNSFGTLQLQHQAPGSSVQANPGAPPPPLGLQLPTGLLSGVATPPAMQREVPIPTSAAAEYFERLQAQARSSSSIDAAGSGQVRAPSPRPSSHSNKMTTVIPFSPSPLQTSRASLDSTAAGSSSQPQPQAGSAGPLPPGAQASPVLTSRAAMQLGFHSQSTGPGRSVSPTPQQGNWSASQLQSTEPAPVVPQTVDVPAGYPMLGVTTMLSLEALANQQQTSPRQSPVLGPSRQLLTSSGVQSAHLNATGPARNSAGGLALQSARQRVETEFEVASNSSRPPLNIQSRFLAPATSSGSLGTAEARDHGESSPTNSTVLLRAPVLDSGSMANVAPTLPLVIKASSSQLALQGGFVAPKYQRHSPTELEQAAGVLQLQASEVQDISSIDAVSPLSRSELQLPQLAGTDKQDIIEHQLATTKLVNQLASCVKSLEADMDVLRRENRNLRKTVAQIDPGNSALAGGVPATSSGAGNVVSRPSSPGGCEDTQGSYPSVTLAAAPINASAENLELRTAPIPEELLPTSSSSSTMPPKEMGGVQYTPNRQVAGPANLHGSPRFGQTPGLTTPSPGRRMLVQGLRHDSPMAMDPIASPPPTLERPERSPTVESTVTIDKDAASPDPSPPVHERMPMPKSEPAKASTAPVDSSKPDSSKVHHTFLRKRTGFGGSVPMDPRVSAELQTEAAEGLHHKAADKGLVQYATLGTVDGRRPWTSSSQASPVVLNEKSFAWSMDQTIWLGSEGDEEHFIGKARLLQKDTVVSVSAAVEGLNCGTLRCVEDFCIAYSMSNHGYYLLYRQGLQEEAVSLASRPPPVAATPSSSSRPVQPAAAAPAADEVSTKSATPPTSEASVPVGQLGPMQPPPVDFAPFHHTNSQPGGQQLPQQSVPQVLGPEALASHYGPAARLPTEPPQAVETPMPTAAATGQQALSQQARTKSPQEILAGQLRHGMKPSEDVFNAAIAAVGTDSGTDGLTQIEEWLWLALDMEIVLGEASFNTVVRAACKHNMPEKAEDILLQMLHLGRRPSKEIFDVIISVFSDRSDAAKVEEWLLHAGQSGWTPESPAFESVVMLFSQVDAAKAEEWMSRAQQTEYRLPDTCFEAVVRAFIRVGSSKKANEWLSRMLADDRAPNEATLQEAVSLLIAAGDVPHAEAWLGQLATRPNAALEAHCHAIFAAAMRSGDLDCAERQIEALGDADPDRTESVVMAHAKRGDSARAKAALERYRALGGAPTPEINLAMMSTCATAGDREGVEAIARMLAHTGHLSKAQVPLLAQVMGEKDANTLFQELSKQAPKVRSTGEPTRSESPSAATKGQENRRARAATAGASTLTRDRLAKSKAEAKSTSRRVGGGGGGAPTGRTSRSPR